MKTEKDMEELDVLGESAESEEETEETEQLQMPDYEEEILKVIRSNASPRMMERNLSDYHPKDIAEVLPELTDKERKKLYRILSVPVLTEILEYGSEDVTGGYLDEMDLPKAAAILSEMETDIAVNVLREIERGKRLLLIDAMDGEARREVALIASYDEDEIGSRMTTNCIIIRENLSVKGAMTELLDQAARNDNISTLFVVDEYGAFYGALDLKKLIIARENEDLEPLIVTSFPYVYGHESIEDCIEKLKDYSEDSIPVLDNNNRIQGVITSQSIIEVADDEMREDYAMLAGLTAREDLEEPLKVSMGKRLPWLLILLGLSLVVSAVVGVFERVVDQLPLIMAFQSMILGMAGNVGTQSLAVTIRVLMDESLTARQKLTLVSKEIRVGLANGFILGVISFVLVGLFIWLVKSKELLFSFAVSGCIGVSLLLAMLISSAVGTLIPLFFKKINIDPAVASGPLITTVNDLVAVLTYYGISWALLLNVLQFVA